MKLIQKPKTLTEEAFEILQDAIINNHLQFNVLYSATELGQMLGGISRTPVREAAQMLEKIGIVKIEKNIRLNLGYMVIIGCLLYWNLIQIQIDQIFQT